MRSLWHKSCARVFAGWHLCDTVLTQHIIAASVGSRSRFSSGSDLDHDLDHDLDRDISGVSNVLRVPSTVRKSAAPRIKTEPYAERH